ncbi:MAG: hypothetical protein ACLTYN_15190 [Dysosmobacter welbionis]
MTDKGGVEVKLIDRIQALRSVQAPERERRRAGELCRVLTEAAGGGKEGGTTAEITVFPKQRRVLTWWCRPGGGEAIICDGAVRSGKTFSIGLSLLPLGHGQINGRQLGLCGKAITSCGGTAGGAGALSAAAGLRLLGAAVGGPATVRLEDHENRFLLFGRRDESARR